MQVDNLSWFPGHMTKTRRMITAEIKNMDAVCEILDARIPLSSRNPDVDELTAGKPRLVVLNRVDQADPGETRRWTAYFREKGYAVLEANAKGGAGTAQFAAAVREERSLRRGPEQIDFEPVHRFDPGDQIVGEHLDGRHRAGLEERLEDHEGLSGVVRVVAGLEIAGDDVVFGAVEEGVDVPEAGAHLFAGPEFARHAQGVAEHHAGECAGDFVFDRHVVCVLSCAGDRLAESGIPETRL